MNKSTWTESDTALAEQIWLDYQVQHDLSKHSGKTAGVDPEFGRVWIGDSIQNVLAQRDAVGINALLFFERIGAATYYRKGGRR